MRLIRVSLGVLGLLCPIVSLAADDIYNPCSFDDVASLPFCNVSLPAETRAADLVSRMTLQEKVSQMIDQAVEIPRLHIPKYDWWSECLHGVLAHCTDDGRCPTSYPMPINSGASFNMNLVHQMAQQISTEARRLYVDRAISFSTRQTGLDVWAPNVNIFRDPRWGRGQEVPGEDPYLNGQYAVRFIQGLQEGEDYRYLKLVATIKHFDAYSLESWNGTDRHHFDAIVSDTDLVQTYLPAFRAGIVEGRSKSLMCSVNSVNGIPSCANKFLLQTILKDEWGFDGYIVSDCGAVHDVIATHKYTSTPEETVNVTLAAGTDLDCGKYYLNVESAVNKSIVSESAVDLAVGRLFTYRIRLGMFDPLEQQPYLQYPKEVVGASEHRDLARQLARESMTLLKNDMSFLPLNKANKQKIALIGPHFDAKSELCGNYHGQLPHIVSPLEGFVNAVGQSNILTAQGCAIHSNATDGFAQAVTAAQKADVAILFVGSDQKVESEGLDRYEISFQGPQESLIKAVSSVQPNTIVVLINGGPIDISAQKQDCNVKSILEAFYPGEEGGNAIADVIFGDYSPSGRLPYTIYPKEYINQISLEEMAMTSGPGRTYRFYKDKPVYPFGYGLSYTSFSYNWSSVEINPDVVVGKSSLPSASYRVKVTNTGSVAGDTSVLAFMSFHGEASELCPIKQLFGFQKISLNPDETKEVFFSTTPADAFCAHGSRRFVDSGEYRVKIGDLEHSFHHAATSRLYI